MFIAFLAYAMGLQGGQQGDFPCIWASTGQQKNVCDIDNTGNSEGFCVTDLLKNNVLLADHVRQCSSDVPSSAKSIFVMHKTF